MTADGFFAGPNGEIDWHVVDAEFNEYAIAMLHDAGTILFGRVTYEMMANYWPTVQALTDDPIVADQMNNLQKIVFSKTQGNLAWNNATVMGDIVPEEILKIKQRVPKDILILGSGTIVSALAELGLIDEYRFIVNPIVLGHGKALFGGIKERIKLKFLRMKTFISGNVLLYYEPVDTEAKP